MDGFENRFPPGWDEERVRRVLEHYESRYERYILEKIARGRAAIAEGRTYTHEEVNEHLGLS